MNNFLGAKASQFLQSLPKGPAVRQSLKQMILLPGEVADPPPSRSERPSEEQPQQPPAAAEAAAPEPERHRRTEKEKVELWNEALTASSAHLSRPFVRVQLTPR